MEENKLVLVEEGEEVEYRVLLDVEGVDGKNYIVYTKDEKQSNGDIISYAATYEENENTGNIKLTSIKDDKEWEFIKDILNSLQNEEEVNNG